MKSFYDLHTKSLLEHFLNKIHSKPIWVGEKTLIIVMMMMIQGPSYINATNTYVAYK